MTTEQLRIMQVISNLEVGGAQEMVRTLSKGLSEAGCDVVVCTFQDGPLRKDIEAMGIPVEVLPERRHSIVELPRFVREIFRLRGELVRVSRKHGADVMQTHLLRSMDFLVLSLRIPRGPRVFWTFHNSLFDLRADHLARHQWLLKPKRLSHHLLYRLGSDWVDGIVAVSEDVKRSILKTMAGIPREKISVIPNCVDVTRYRPRDEGEKLRRNLGFGARDHLMTTVAILKPQKGHRFLLEAAARLVPEFPHLHLLLVGDGELRDELQRFSARKGIDENVHFLGTRPDVPEILSASDSFVLPSLWEGLPMALIEAMASGLPVIATDVSGTREVMQSGETGALIPPGDAQALLDAIASILEDPDSWRAMGVAGRKRVEDHYSVQKQARDYVTLFKKKSHRRLIPLASDLKGMQ